MPLATETAQTDEARMRDEAARAAHVGAPDPSVATISLVRNSVQALKDLTDAKEATLAVRLDNFDKTLERLNQYPNKIDLAVESLRRYHDEKFETASQIRQLNTKKLGERLRRIEEASDLKFQQIKALFEERDKRSDQLTQSNKDALVAALQYQKDAAIETQRASRIAIDKSEHATTESIKQLQTLFQSDMAAMRTQIGDLKSRLDKGEGQTSVSDPHTRESLREISGTIKTLSANDSVGTGRFQQAREGLATMFSAIALIIAIAGVVVEMLWRAR